MDENEVQRKRRQNEEEATARRARILALPYLDTRDFENDIPLVSCHDHCLDIVDTRIEQP